MKYNIIPLIRGSLLAAINVVTAPMLQPHKYIFPLQYDYFLK